MPGKPFNHSFNGSPISTAQGNAITLSNSDQDATWSGGTGCGCDTNVSRGVTVAVIVFRARSARRKILELFLCMFGAAERVSVNTWNVKNDTRTMRASKSQVWVATHMTPHGHIHSDSFTTCACTCVHARS